MRLVIIADDFTGALDTGVQFAQTGARTVVLSQKTFPAERPDADVLVLDAQTRHLPPEDAYRIVYELSLAAASFPGVCL